MSNKSRAMLGSGLGLIWSAALLIGAGVFVQIPVFALIPTIMTAFFSPGLVMAAMVARVALRRFVEVDTRMEPLSEAGEMDRRVLQNTVEQLVIAAAIWPAAAVLLGPAGPGVIIALGLGFAVARLLFWVGCHRSPMLRSVGFAATFFPSVLVALWALIALAI
ncbi:MAG: MAPEG family protein [Pseudomonadota bacterium]